MTEVQNQPEAAADALLQYEEQPQVPQPATKPPLRQRLLGALVQVRGFSAFLVLLLTAVASGFIDPEFGWNMRSLRLVLVFITVFVLLNYTGAFVKWVVAKKKGMRPRMMARPVYLLILIITVLFARGTGVQPALVFGTVIALDYATQDIGESEALSRSRAAAAAMAGAIWAFMLGLAAWLAYTFIAQHPFTNLVHWEEIVAESAILLDDALNMGSLVAIELSFTLAIAAIGSMPLMLLPLRMFDGGAIWRWRRTAWFVVYAIALMLYSFVLVPMPGSWDGIDGTVIAWFVVFAIYAAVAVAVTVAFAVANKRSERAVTTEEVVKAL